MRHTTKASERASHPEVDAFNAAFDELGFDWHWDRATMAELASIADDRGRVRAYVTKHHPHLLKVYDADFICELVVATKARQARTPGGGTGTGHSPAAPQHSAFA